MSQTKQCRVCKLTKPATEFYWNSRRTHRVNSCKTCEKQRVSSFRKELKRKAVEYKGGECSRCGYNRSYAALDFHHLDPNEKVGSISKWTTLSWDKVKVEIDKCVLLCANCHREEHHDADVSPLSDTQSKG